MRFLHNVAPVTRIGTMPLLVSAVILACQLIPASTPTAEPPQGATATVSSTASPVSVLPTKVLALTTQAPLLPTVTPIPVLATAKETLNIRAQPATTAQIIGRLNKGETVTVTGKNLQGDWWQIALPSNPAGRGWISATFTTVAGPVDQIAVAGSSPQLQTAVSVTPRPPSGSVTPIASPGATNTSGPLLGAPQLIQPGNRASYAARAPVILTWTWVRAIASGEFYEIQLSREGTEPKDFACTTLLAYQINSPPENYGWYQWRIVVRRGNIQGSQCTTLGDVSQPSETRSFEWRSPPEPPTPTPRTYP